MKIFSYAIVAVSVLVNFSASAQAASANQPKVEWSVNVDQRLPNSPVALSTPAVLKHGQETWLVMGARDGWVHVYDIDGSEVRRFPLGGKSDSGALALSNGLVVLGDIAGRLYAVDPAKGKVVWQAQLTSTFTSAPVAVDQGFLVQTTDNRIYRFSEEGTKLWSFSGQKNTLSMYMTPAPIVADGYVFALLGNGDAVALMLESGDLLWKRQMLLSNDSAVLSELKSPLAAPLLVKRLHMGGEQSENTLLMSFFQGEMIALSAKDGTQSFNLPISLKSTPLVTDSILYAADSQGYLYAYDIKQGNRLWRKQISTDELLGPVLWQDSIWMADNKGMVYTVNKDGELQGSVSLAGGIARLPVTTDAGLLLRTVRGAMYLVSK